MVASTHPFDVVGWDGCLYPYTFNVDDFEPITGRVHQPPPVHQVFEGNNFVVCNFVPRKVDYHPLAIPVPYYHSNVDSDEVMFYCGGDYEARKGSGIGLGSVTLHPGGHSHGPQPGAAEASIGKHYFDELAVMVDTFRPLELGEGGLASDDDAVRVQLGQGPPTGPGLVDRLRPGLLDRIADAGQLLRGRPQPLGQLRVAGLGGPPHQGRVALPLPETVGTDVAAAGQVLSRREQLRQRPHRRGLADQGDDRVGRAAAGSGFAAEQIGGGQAGMGGHGPHRRTDRRRAAAAARG